MIILHVIPVCIKVHVVIERRQYTKKDIGGCYTTRNLAGIIGSENNYVKARKPNLSVLDK